MRKYILLLAFLLPALASGQSTQVTVVGIPPVLSSPFISDFEQNVFNGNYAVHLNIIGSGTAPVEIEFRAEVFKDGQKLIDETSMPVSFTPGFHVLSPFPEFVEFEATTYDILNGLPSNMFNQVIQSGSFPEGDYTITFTANRTGSANQTSLPGSANFMVRYPQPPVPITPANGSQVAVQVPIFSWAPAITPPGVNVEYDILLVELFDDQNPGDALLSNRPHAAFEILNNTVVPYTGEFLPLENGRTYAWQINASDSGDQFPFKNDGRSEIYVFTYGEEDDTMEALASIQPTDISTVFFTPITTITGNVNWAFKRTEGGEGIPPVTPPTTQTYQTTNSHIVSNAIDDPNFVLGIDAEFEQSVYTDVSSSVFSGSATTVSSDDVETGQHSSSSAVPVFGSGLSTEVHIGIIPDTDLTLDNVTTHVYPGARIKAVVEGRGHLQDHVIATTTADEEGNFSLIFAPSELNQFVRTATQTDNSAAEQELDDMFNTAAEDRRGGGLPQGPQNMSGANVTVTIVVDSEYFDFPIKSTVSVNTNEAQEYNTGTITGFARTYRFTPEVIHADVQSEIPEAVIEVFRQENWYDNTPEVRPEGAPVTDEEREELHIINGRPHFKIAEIRSGGTITRLFPRKKGFKDRYSVRVSAEGYKTTTSYLSATPELSLTNVVTINRTYSLEQSDPIVEGRVLRVDNMAHMQGATVSLWKGNDHSPAYSAVTNNEGRFIISDIEKSEDPYMLRVSGARISTYEEEVTLNQNGIVIERDPLLVSPALITVVGSVINDDGVPLNNATVRWKSGGNPVQTDEEGRFVTANTSGTHELEIRKIGHRDKYRTVTIEVEDNWEGMSLADDGPIWNTQYSQDYVSTAGQWAEEVMNTSTFQQSSSPFNPATGGYSGNLEAQFGLSTSQTESIVNSNNLDLQPGEFDAVTVYFSDLMGEDGTPGGIEDIGAIVMNRSVGRLLVTVEDEELNQPIPDASVSVGISGTEGETNEQGEIFFSEAPGGTMLLKVGPPEGTNYVALATEITVSDAGDTTSVHISMEIGGRAEGVVMAGGEPVENATVRVVGWEETSTRTDSDGSYVLPGVPLGYWELSASKSGFVGQIEAADFSANQTETINFELGDAGFEISSLLGFEIEVDEVIVSNDTTITGAFISLQSNTLFDIDENLRLPFSGIKVYEHEGVLLPVDGEVVTNVSEISATLFDYMYINIKNSAGLVVRPRQLIMSSVGFISGRVEVDYASTFTSATGWSWPQEADQFLTIPNIESLPSGIGENELVVLTSDGSFPFPDISVVDFEFTFGSVGRSLDLFGFDIDLNVADTKLRNDGIHTGGEIMLSNIPLLDEASLTLEKLWIGIDGSVREATLELDPNPQLILANWDMQLNSGSIMENGLLLGGALMVALPGSDMAEIAFSKLGISGAQLHGGKFTFPVEGIDIFGIASLRSNPGKDITFGKVQGESIYYMAGSAVIGLPRLIERELEFKEFLIRTDGQFNANIAANFEADFYGLADLSVSGVSFQNTSSPEIRIDGQFGLHAIPFITAQAGGLTFRPGSVSVDEIHLGFEIAGVAEAQVGIQFLDEGETSGFKGMGMLAIQNTPINASIGFQYMRQPEGVMFGAEFEAGIPPIPIGAFAIDNLGGGFTYNRSASEYSVSLSGRVSVAGTGAALSIDPLSVTVASGPVITGSATVSVLTESIADANLVIDFPNALFDLEAELTFDMLEDVDINVDRRARIVVSAAENNTFWMAGARMDAQLMSLFDATANILAVWDMNLNQYPEYATYTSFVDADYIHGGVATGLFLKASLDFGIPKSDPACLSLTAFGLPLGEGCGYFENQTQCMLSADLEGSQFGIHIGSDWKAGGDLNVIGYPLVSVDAWAVGEISGGYSNGLWTAYGLAQGEVAGSVFSCDTDDNCNSFCGSGLRSTGYKFCAGAEIEVDYSSSRGMNVSAGLSEQ